MSQKPRILFLSHCLPYPPQSGVISRTFNILMELGLAFDVTLLAFWRSCHQPDVQARDEAAGALGRFLGRVATPVRIPGDRSKGRKLWDHLRSVVSRRPYTFFEYESGDFRSQLRRLLSGAPFDLIHLDSLDLHGWLGELPRVPIACTHHNVESHLLRLQARWLKSPLLVKYLLHQADLLQGVERALCPQFGVNLMTSDLDAERLAALAPEARTRVVPNGVDTAYFFPLDHVPVVPGRIVFVGGTHTLPNRDAVAYLLSEVWPLIRRRRRDASLRLIGGGRAPFGVRYDADPGVQALGRVPDIRRHVAESCCCVVPLRAGGGTRVKILDAWAMGKAVVSTSVGCEGLDAVDGDNILVRDDPREFAEATLDVLENAELRSRLGAQARATVERVYSWGVIGRVLRETYRDLVATCSPGRKGESVRQVPAERPMPTQRERNG